MRTQAAWTGLLLLAIGCRGKSGEEPRAEDTAGAELPPPQRLACGAVTCEAGQVCCNPSCGICTAPESMCTQQFCDQSPPVEAGEAPPAPATPSCDNVRCEADTHCELVPVQCVRAPCDPVPQCVPERLIER